MNSRMTEPSAVECRGEFTREVGVARGQAPGGLAVLDAPAGLIQVHRWQRGCRAASRQQAQQAKGDRTRAGGPGGGSGAGDKG